MVMCVLDASEKVRQEPESGNSSVPDIIARKLIQRANGILSNSLSLHALVCSDASRAETTAIRLFLPARFSRDWSRRFSRHSLKLGLDTPDP